MVPATDPSGRSLFVCRRRCHGCCHLFAAVMVRQAVPATAATTTTHRRHRRQQHGRRPLTSVAAHLLPRPLPRLLLPLSSGYGTSDRPCRPLASLPAPQSPLPLARLPLVDAAAVRSESMKTTNATATTGRRHRKQQQGHRPFTYPTAPRSPPPLPRLLLSLCCGYIFSGFMNS